MVGPWIHNGFDSTIGDVNFGSCGGNIKSYDDYLNMELQWFDRWMKDDLSVDVGKAVKVLLARKSAGIAYAASGRTVRFCQ